MNHATSQMNTLVIDLANAFLQHTNPNSAEFLAVRSAQDSSLVLFNRDDQKTIDWFVIIKNCRNHIQNAY